MAIVIALDKDPLQLELLTLLLRRDRHRVLTTPDPDAAIVMIQAEPVDLVIVETVMTRHDGYRVCREIQQLRPEVGLMIVSERTEETEVVRGLLSGADDYVVKPYSPREFLARVQVILRRVRNGHRAASAPSQVTMGEISLNVAQLHAVVNGRQIALTPREFSLLHALMTNADRVLSRDQLMRLAWGDAFVGSKAIDVCVQRIRRKLQPFLLAGPYVEAVRGYGYKFARPLSSFVDDALQRSASKSLPAARAPLAATR